MKHRLLMPHKVIRRGNAWSVHFRCNDGQEELHDLYNARQEYLSNGLGTADLPLHLEQQWVLQQRLLQCGDEQFRTPIMCDK